METNETKLNQKVIFQQLLEETFKDFASQKDIDKGNINIGANEHVFSFRNSGRGIAAGKMARGVFPGEEDQQPEGTSSWTYDVSGYFDADVFEAQSFQNNKCSLLKYSKGKLALFSVYPDYTPQGVLFRVVWDNELAPNSILTVKDVRKAIRKMDSRHLISWKPVVFFNGNKIQY